MKIKLFSTGDVRDVAPDVGEMMVQAGLAEALTPKEVNEHSIRAGVPFHSLNWFARDGEVVDGGYQYAPALVWRCQTCAQLTFNHPEKAPAANSVFHFEKHTCPDDVYRAYLKLFEAWSKKGGRKLKGIYERVIENARQRTKDGLDDRQPGNNPAKSGAAVAI